MLLLLLLPARAAEWEGQWQDAENRTFEWRTNVTVVNDLNFSRSIPVTFRTEFTWGIAPYCNDSNDDDDLHDVGLDLLSLKMVREYGNGTLADVPFHVSDYSNFFYCSGNQLIQTSVTFPAELPGNGTNDGFGPGTSQFWLYYHDEPYPLFSNSTLRDDLRSAGGGVWEYTDNFFVNTTLPSGTHQVNLTMDTETLINRYHADFYCEDFRFVSDGQELDYWVENCDTPHTSFWVEFPGLDSEELYPASYSFREEKAGTANDSISFFDSVDIPSGGSINVTSSKDGHDKVVWMRDADSSHVWGNHTGFDESSGTVEFWWRSSDSSKTSIFYMYDDGVGTAMSLNMRDNGQFSWFDGSSYHDVGAYSADEWYHNKIVFDCSAGTNGQFIWYVNGTPLASNVEFRDNCASLDKLLVGTGDSSAGFDVFFDAFGFSWDAGYGVGDNVRTGNLTEVTAYYGNPLASPVSNGNDTFIFFDTFEPSINTDNWTWYGAGSSSATQANQAARLEQVSGETLGFRLLNPFDLSMVAIDYRGRYWSGPVQNRFAKSDGQNVTEFRHGPAGNNLTGLASGSAWVPVLTGMDVNTYYDISLGWDSSRSEVVVTASGNSTSYKPEVHFQDRNFSQAVFQVADQESGLQYLDDFRIRHYFYPEPSVDSGHEIVVECPDIFPMCCNASEKYENGVCCHVDLDCCLTTQDCDTESYEVCDQRKNHHFCYISKPNGVSCVDSANCSSGYCNGHCCPSQPPLAEEMGNCAASGSRCSYEDSGGLLCCHDDSDCGGGFFCYTENMAYQCLACETSGNGVCSSSSCIGFDPDCCSSDADCGGGEWCSGIACQPCREFLDFSCPSTACLGFDPDCCNADNPCTVGLVCDTSRSPPSCVAPVGDSCDSDADCRASSVCRSSLCVLDNFVVLESTSYLSSLGGSLNVPVNVIDPMHRSGTYKAAVEGAGRNFARFPDASQEYTFNLEGGEGRQIPLTFIAGALGNYEVRVKVWNLERPEIVSTQTFTVTVQGGTTSPMLMSAPEMGAAEFAVLFLAASLLYWRRSH